MRSLDLRYVVAVGALSFAFTGCLTNTNKDAEIDTAADAGDDNDDDNNNNNNNSDPDTAIWEINISGQATVDATTWAGTETWQTDDLTNGGLLCIWTMESASSTPLDTCESCEFAFDVGYANSTIEQGDCEAIGFPAIPGEINTQDGPLKNKIGFVPEYTTDQGTFANLMFMYYPGGTYEAGWYPWSYEGGGTYENGVFNYARYPIEIEGY